jgi:hypothetical protein
MKKHPIPRCHLLIDEGGTYALPYCHRVMVPVRSEVTVKYRGPYADYSDCLIGVTCVWCIKRAKVR